MGRKKYRIEEVNLDPNIDFSVYKADIERKRYSYYDFSLDGIRKIAESDINALEPNDLRAIVQCLYPKFLVCSGLFDAILLFDVRPSGDRIDPPFASWRYLGTAQNEFKDSPLMADSISKLFKANGIKPHESWNRYLQKCRKDFGRLC